MAASVVRVGFGKSQSIAAMFQGSYFFPSGPTRTPLTASSSPERTNSRNRSSRFGFGPLLGKRLRKSMYSLIMAWINSPSGVSSPVRRSPPKPRRVLTSRADCSAASTRSDSSTMRAAARQHWRWLLRAAARRRHDKAISKERRSRSDANSTLDERHPQLTSAH
jgi:hypothetical protein